MLQIYKISIITVVYNSVHLLSKTIDSVQNLNYNNIEYIIIDGGSTDGTLELIQKNIDKVNVLVSERDLGIYDAMNKGVLLATGEYINFLNSGDSHDSEFLNRVFLESFDEKYDYYHSNMRLIKQNTNIGIARPITTNKYKFHMANPILHPTLIVKKSAFNELGLFDLNFKIASDHDWVNKLVTRYNGLYSDTMLTNFLVGGVSSGIDALNESRAILKKNGIKTIPLNFIYLINLVKIVLRKIVNN